MPKITVAINDPSLDGEYEVEFPPKLTHREHHFITHQSNVRPYELLQALAESDAGAWVAFTSVILTRAGKLHDVETLWDAPEDGIRLSLSDGDAVIPPPETPPATDESDAPAE